MQDEFERARPADWYEPPDEPELIDCKSCFIVHAVGEGREGCQGEEE